MRTTAACIAIVMATSLAGVSAATTGPYPIILIPGWCSGDALSVWEPFRATVQNAAPARFGNGVTQLYFDEAANAVRSKDGQPFASGDPSKMLFTIDFFDSHTGTFDPTSVADISIEEKALQLKRVIDQAKHISGKDRVILVGFSQGGLVARTYVQNVGFVSYDDDVERIVTLDTPHEGSPLADSSLSWTEVLTAIPLLKCIAANTTSKVEMAPTSPFLHDLNYAPLPRWLPFGFSPIATWVAAAYEGRPIGDGIVPFDSQALTNSYRSETRIDVRENVRPVGSTAASCLDSNNLEDPLCQVHTLAPADPEAIALIRLAIQEVDKAADTVHVWANPTASPSNTVSTVQVSGENFTANATAHLLISPPGSTLWIDKGAAEINADGRVQWNVITTCTDSPGTWKAVVRDSTSWVPGDINGDGIVNTLDWSFMNARWFGSDPGTDLNGDGIVNSLDWSIMNAHWFRTGATTGATFVVGRPSGC